MPIHPFRDPRLLDRGEPAIVAMQCCEQLVRWNERFELQPWLLEGWSVSRDARIYTLRMRDGVRWSNGDTLDADDLLHNLRRWCARDVPGNSMAGRLDALVDPASGRLREEAVERLDRQTLRLTLSRPNAALIANFSDYPALLMHRSYLGSDDPKEALAIGTGPYMLEDYAVGESASVTRNERAWWGGPTGPERILWLDHGSDSQTIVEAAAAGEIDATFNTQDSALEPLSALGFANVGSHSPAALVVRARIDAPPFDDLDFRRALQLSVDRDVVMQLAISGRGVVGADHHVAPMQPDHADIGPAPTDRHRAREIVRAKSTIAPLTLHSVDEGWQRAAADAVAEQLRRSGLEVERAVLPAPAYWSAWNTLPFSTTGWAGRPLGVQILDLAYRSTAAWNETGFADAGFDALLDRALAAATNEERRPIMADLQTRLRDSGVIIQPFWRDVYRSHRPGIQGYDGHHSLMLYPEKIALG